MKGRIEHIISLVSGETLKYTTEYGPDGNNTGTEVGSDRGGVWSVVKETGRTVRVTVPWTSVVAYVVHDYPEQP